MKHLPLLLVTILLFTFCIYNNTKINELTSENTKLVQQLKQANSGEEEHFELAVLMTRMQIHFNKLWFAGKNENWELAQFYTHEIEESLEELIKNKVIDDGINVSTLAETMTKKPFHQLEQAAMQGPLADFETAYTNMVNTCNRCHQASAHSFIRIQLPKQPAFDNQLYTKE